MSLKNSFAIAEYVITVWTGNLPLAGTDSRVYVTLFGREGVGPRTRLHYDRFQDADDLDRKKSKHPFRKGQKDTFVISSDYHGPITRIRSVPNWSL